MIFSSIVDYIFVNSTSARFGPSCIFLSCMNFPIIAPTTRRIATRPNNEINPKLDLNYTYLRSRTYILKNCKKIIKPGSSWDSLAS